MVARTPKTHIVRPELPFLTLCGHWSQDRATIELSEENNQPHLCSRCVGLAYYRRDTGTASASIHKLPKRRQQC